MKNWKKGLIGTAIISIGLFLAACSSSSTQDSTTKTSTQAGDKDTFTYAISGDPTSTNPINTSDRWGLTVTNMIYSPLVIVEADGTTQNALADSVEPAEDGLSLTVHLKKDVKWSDGEAFTAEDVVFTYEQKVKKENGNADALWVDGKPVSIEKVDDYTVKFVLPSASAAALNNIATETYIIPEHIYKDVTDFSVSELPETPVGTGPYKLKEYKRGEYFTFEANENYYGGEAAIKNVTLRIIESTDTAKVALQKGEVDAAVVLPSDIEDLDESMISVYPYTENRVGYLGLNTHFDTPYSFLPPNNPYATEDVEKYETNVEKAKELLQEAGVSNLQLNLAFTSTDPAQTIQATLIQQQLQQAGINVSLEGGDGTAIFTELKKAGSTKYNLFLGGYIMGNDPDLYGMLFKTDGSSNYFQTQNNTTDDLFAKAAVELDETKRKELYDQLQQAIADDARIYPIVDNKKILAVNNRIANVEEAGLIPIYTFEDMSKLTIK